MAEITEKVGSYNEFVENNPDAGVGAYTEALVRNRCRVARLAGVSLEELHEVRFPDAQGRLPIDVL